MRCKLTETLNDVLSRFWATFDASDEINEKKVNNEKNANNENDVSDNLMAEIKKIKKSQKRQTASQVKSGFSVDEYDAFSDVESEIAPIHSKQSSARSLRRKAEETSWQRIDPIPQKAEETSWQRTRPKQHSTEMTVRPQFAPIFQETSANKSRRNFVDDYNMFSNEYESSGKNQKRYLTDKQLRALNRKHLLMMIRDLEKELAQEKKEKENLLMVCKMVNMQR